jgi:hypothetical protein
VSAVQATASAQLMSAPEHVPFAHTSPEVHALPSLQGAALFVWKHPLAGLHASSVHGLPSLQSTAGPATQDPEVHASPEVHAFPSLHGPETGGPG